MASKNGVAPHNLYSWKIDSLKTLLKLVQQKKLNMRDWGWHLALWPVGSITTGSESSSKPSHRLERGSVNLPFSLDYRASKPFILALSVALPRGWANDTSWSSSACLLCSNYLQNIQSVLHTSPLCKQKLCHPQVACRKYVFFSIFPLNGW